MSHVLTPSTIVQCNSFRLKKDLHRQLSEGNQKLHSFIDYKYNRNQDIDDSDDDIHLVETLYNGKVPGDIKLHRSTGCSPNTTLSIGETPPDNDKFRHSMGSSNLQRRSSKKSTSPKSRKSEYPATLMKQYAFPEDDRLRNSLRGIDGSGRSSRSPRSRKSEPSATARNEDNSPKKLNKSGRVLHSYSVRSSSDQIGKKTKRNPDELHRRSSGLGDKRNKVVERSSKRRRSKRQNRFHLILVMQREDSTLF